MKFLFDTLSCVYLLQNFWCSASEVVNSRDGVTLVIVVISVRLRQLHKSNTVRHDLTTPNWLMLIENKLN